MDYNAFGQRTKKHITGIGASTQLEMYDFEGRLVGVYSPDASGGFSVKEELIYLDNFRVIATIRPHASSGMSIPQVHPIVTDLIGSPRFILSPITTQPVWS